MKMINGKGKVSPCFLTEHHAMKPYWGNGGIAPHIHDGGIYGGDLSASKPATLILGKEPLVPIG
jgi:hypothetical protein